MKQGKAIVTGHLPLSWAQVPRFELNYGDPTAATNCYGVTA
jgi:hypothetical protein